MPIKDGDYIADGGPVLVACGQGKSMYNVKGCMSSWVLVGGGGGEQPDAVKEKMAAAAAAGGGAGGGGRAGGIGELFTFFFVIFTRCGQALFSCMVDVNPFPYLLAFCLG